MILRDLLSLSAEFETGVLRPKEMPAIAALRMLAGLEAVARLSLAHRFAGATAPPARPTPSATTGIRAPAPPPGRIAIPPAPSSPSLWSTRSKTYRPALGDPSVIEALLKFRDQAPSIDSPTAAPRPPTPTRAPAPPQAPVPAPAPKNQLAASPEIHPARLERLSAKDLERCFPFEPSSKLLRPRQ